MRKIVFACALAGACVAFGEAEMVDAVDPMIGAITSGANRKYGGHGLGKTFPGAATPFGMVQLSPDTITGGDNGPGYSYENKTIEGFSFTHLSGIGWYGDFGNLQMMPTTGPLVLDRELACSPFSHSSETAAAGYYAVTLDRYSVRAEATAAPRSGVLRFTYPDGQTRRVQIDLARRVGQTHRWLTHSRQTVTLASDRAIEGEIDCRDLDGGWGHGSGKVNYVVRFRAEFSAPIVRAGAWRGGPNAPPASPLAVGETFSDSNSVFFAEFAPSAQPLVVKAGLSYVSVAGARANLERDVPDFDFDAVRANARSLWRDALSRVSVKGGTADERAIFATALYHAFIDPRAIADYNGTYMGSDGKPYTSGAFTMRTVFSGWDVFRSAFPLYTIVRPDVVSDTINSMMRWTDLGPRTTLPVWDIFGCTSGCMGGTPLVSVIADANRAGIRSFNLAHAYDLVVKSVPPKSSKPGAAYFSNGSLSASLDLCYYDWCAARLAESLGRADDAKFYDSRAACYTNLWCADVGWMRTRKCGTASGWLEPWQGKEEHGQGCTEANPWQAGWFVPHDVHGLAELMGGDAACAAELERFFEAAPAGFAWNNGYNHANEPVHQAAFMFTPLGRPDLTQKWTRRVCAGAYGTGVTGLCGNEDVGQMSAWYVLAAAGIHPICPGSGEWIITAPVFAETMFRLDPRYAKGKAFTIRASGTENPANVYVRSAKLNGLELARRFVTIDEITAGGVLEIALGPNPQR